MKCKCGIEYKMVLMPYDEYEALCPVCDLGKKDPLLGHLENNLIKKELLLDY